VIGSWRIAVDAGSAHGPTNLAIFSPDGSVLFAFPSPTPAAPGAGHRLEYWTPAIGSWTGASERGASMAFVALGVDENGAPVGTHTVTATVEADTDGQSWQGPFQIAIAGPDGAVQASVAGTVNATRITADGKPA
jgi:hypothetical protein